ncbi:MAG: site-specific integrase [Myxococcaceae bacterium]|nr:site-specific integrase [Myxococcaceae bacterium]
MRPTTAGGYRYICQNRILPEWGELRLRALRAVEVQAFLASELRRGQAPSTVRQTLRILRIALERARGFGFVKVNVAREVVTPRVPRPVIVPLAPGEVRALLRATRGDAVGRLVVLGLAGLRAGELRGLQWGDLDLRTRRLHVRRTAQWAGKGLDIVPPKTLASLRTIALPRFVVRELAKVSRRERRGFLFAGVKGTPLHGTVLQRWLNRAVMKARLRRNDVTVHLLRHTAAAMLLESAVHLRVVMNVLGHSRVSTTIEVYGHLRPELHAQAAATMDSWIYRQR